MKSLAAVFLMALTLIQARSLGAPIAPDGRVVVVRLYAKSVSDLFPVVEYARQNRWNCGLAIMSTPYQQDMAWLESVLYCGQRGLVGNSRQQYRDKMARLALEPTPRKLAKSQMGWLFTERSQLWGESPPTDKTCLFVASVHHPLAVISTMKYLNPAGDYVVIICGPKQGTRVLSIACFGGQTTGLLTSTTSRSLGILSDTDIRGSVLSMLHVKPERLAHLWSIVSEDAVTSQTRIRRITRLCQINEPLIIWVGVVAAIACILLVGSCLAPGSSRVIHTLRALFAASLAMLPLASSELGRWTISGKYLGDQSGLLLLASCVLAGLVCCVVVRFRAWAAVRLVMFVTICYVSVNTMLGNEWVSTSVISSYVLTGIRLYGIGNEFMGILVGGCLMMVSPSGDKRLAYLLLSLLAVIFAAGMWGANLGGYLTCIAAMVSLGVFGMTIRERKVGYIAAMATGLLAALLMMPWPIIIDSMTSTPTHMGEAAIRASLLGQNALISMFSSKLLLFMRIVTMPFGILTVVGFVLVLWYSAHKLRQHATPERASRYLRWVRVGGFAGVPALLFNDSGIVPAVIIMACVMIYALLIQTDKQVIADA